MLLYKNYTFKDTSDDSCSKHSFSDEETTKRKYITNKNKSNQPLSYVSLNLFYTFM